MLYIYVFILGSILTSFYMVVATRIPNNESIVTPRSHCDNCQKKLCWYELIPILSYFIVRGRCSKCKKKLSIAYPLLEFLGGTLFLICLLKFKISYEFFLGIILSSLFILISVTDFKYFIILDSVLIVSEIVVILVNLLFKSNLLLINLFSGLLMFLIMLLVKKIGDILFKRESLGGGDIKLMFVIGSILGLRLSLVSIVISSFIALFYALYSLYFLKKEEIPFGPFLVLGAFITLILKDNILGLII